MKDWNGRGSFTDNDGDRHFIRAETYEEFRDKKKEMEIELEEGRVIVDKNTPVSTWADTWYETYNKNRQYIGHIKKYFGGKKLKDVRPIDCQNMLNQYAEKYSKSFVDKQTATLKNVFRAAVKNKLIRVSPAEDLTKPEAKEGSHRAISSKERDMILWLCKSHHAGTLLKTILYTGVRPKEARNLKGEDIKGKVLYVKGTKSKAAYRTIPIPDHFYDELNALKDKEYLFTTEKGTRLTKRGMYRWWANFKREMAIALGAEVYRNEVIEKEDLLDYLKDNESDCKLTMYCLRHTYCTDLELAGVPINIAKELMGHSSIEMTAKIYTHFNKETLQIAADLINNKANGTGQSS